MDSQPTRNHFIPRRPSSTLLRRPADESGFGRIGRRCRKAPSNTTILRRFAVASISRIIHSATDLTCHWVDSRPWPRWTEALELTRHSEQTTVPQRAREAKACSGGLDFRRSHVVVPGWVLRTIAAGGLRLLDKSSAEAGAPHVYHLNPSAAVMGKIRSTVPRLHDEILTIKVCLCRPRLKTQTLLRARCSIKVLEVKTSAMVLLFDSRCASAWFG